MSNPASHPLLRLIFSDRRVVATRAGVSTDINHISGSVEFYDFTSTYSRIVECALKELRVSPTNRNQTEWAENVFMVLSEELSARNVAYTHPNIAPVTVVNAIKISDSGPVTFKAILSPWYSRGNVLEYLNTHPSADRITLITELGKALVHLHSYDVVHGAVHPSSILIDNGGHVIVTDAGLRTLLSQYYFAQFSRLPVPPFAVYQPSEQFRPVTDTMVPPTTSTDVCSFATTSWTIFTGRKPFSNLTTAQIVMEIGLHGHQRLIKPSNMSTRLWAILQKCLVVDPALRPTMMEVVAELERLSM